MHYYQFNIGDYTCHTAHLDPLEDIAYRRMLDYIYLNETGLPEDVDEIARVVRMRTHCDSISIVLREFFYQHTDGTYRHKRVDQELSAYKNKSDKAKQSARKRWENTSAKAMPTQSDRNANHKPITKKQEPINNRFTPPLQDEVTTYFVSKLSDRSQAEIFFNFYEAKDWMIGKNKMKKWKMAANNWIAKNKDTGESKQDAFSRLTDRSWADDQVCQ